MKLEVGMYVRNDNGIIGKIYEKIGDMFTYKDSNRDYITYDLLHSEIIKASYNIIDILEVGDYVNGEKVIAFKKDIPERNIYFNSKKCNIFTDYSLVEDWYFGIEDKDIKTIVTKEQMEQMAYKVGK